MSIQDEMQREEQHICDQLNNGEIDDREYSEAMNHLQRQYEYMSEEAAQRAYDDEMRNW